MSTSRKIQTPDDITRLVAFLNKETSAGKVILMAACIEDLLKDILEAFFARDLSEKQKDDYFENGFLQSLVDRGRLCWSLGLLSRNDYNQIKLISKIRNKFAHNPFLEFDDIGIANLCNKLKIRDGYPAMSSYIAATISLIIRLHIQPKIILEKHRLKSIAGD